MATTGPIDLTVNINNINEACYFDKTYYYVTLAEATVGIDLLLLFFFSFRTNHIETKRNLQS